MPPIGFSCASTGLRAIYRVSTRNIGLTSPVIPSRGAGGRDKIGPLHPLPHSTRENVRPEAGPLGLTREITRPTRLKTAFFGRCRRAGRTFSRSGHSHVAALKPTTPLQPLTQATVKPPSPLLTPEQQPLKPTTPLQPKNTPKTPISHPQRRHRFQLKLDLREQRRQGFQSHAGTSEQRRQQFHAKILRHPRAATGTLPRKLARNL